ncbi:septation ring formation regulator EzrA [Cytobacillus gottheilii]|uniref:septation ring formation regulator EzrA n=1 Tax=Cytobacillus gottheilii TaxID=859144 RepID=UPI0009BBD1AF|nr:septation ring formation regulator EzrA [Cytobacillus gottheilii]
MEYIIGGIVIVILIYLTGYFLKKKYYKEVDRLETWKMDIMNRPVLDEMAKVKQLNMTGQTEELFEAWRYNWDEIVTAELPNVEEYLFDAEESIDKYRFNKAKEALRAIESSLERIEEQIKGLLTEVKDLVGSEEKNRLEIEELKENYRENKKILLAHRHTFGKAEEVLEKQFEKAADLFEQFDEKTEQGNYLEAREIVLAIQEILNHLQKCMETIPELLIECQSKLPSQMSDLRDGYKEMQENGYILDHIQLDKDLEQFQQELNQLLESLHKAELENVQSTVDDMRDSIDLLYDLLEQEVHAKHNLQQQESLVSERFYNSLESNKLLKRELNEICESYHVDQQDKEVQLKLEKTLAALTKKYDVLHHKMKSQGSAQTQLQEEFLQIKSSLDEICLEQEVFSEKLQALRKDEMTARETVAELKKTMTDTIKLVSKSNIPGLSQEYKYLVHDTKESLENVMLKLEEKPLNIPTVQQYLEVSVMTVDKLVQYTEEMIETIQLAEKVIQYGNRYRSSYPSIEKALQEAEQAFRSYDYKTSLEQAASSIEEVDPGALKKIEELLKEE